MSHQHRGRVCHLNGCDTDQTVPVECPACEQAIGHAPKGGMAQPSATQDKLRAHLAHRHPTNTGSIGPQVSPIPGLRPTSRTETAEG